MSKLPSFRVSPASVSSKSSAPVTDVVFVSSPKGKGKARPQAWAKSAGPYTKSFEKLEKNSFFSAAFKTSQFIRFGGLGRAENVLVVGMGSSSGENHEKWRQASGIAFAKIKAEKCQAINVRLDLLPAGIAVDKVARAIAEGLSLGMYLYAGKPLTKAQKAYTFPTQLDFQTTKSQTALAKELAEVSASLEAVNFTREWSNLPSNLGTPEFFAAESKKLAKKYGLKCRVLTETDAKREKMGLLLGVQAGSDRGARVVVLEYSPKGGAKKAKTIGLVGKGVTFDSGGISLKPSGFMEDMKHDMTGAATVFGATLLASKWKVKNKIVTVMAFTENMPSGKATQPGNVLTSRSGKTVEVINTDAEGRLVLGDALDYIKKFKPDVIVDVATLTGAVLIALGKQCCGILGNNNDFIQKVRNAGEKCGERIWQLPLYDEYFDDMRSDVADMKNSVNNSLGGTIRGAMFLKQFVGDKIPWAHLDIAATAWNVSHLPYMPKKGASGTYVRTLAHLAADFR